MATPTFEDFYSVASRHNVGLDRAREIYKERYGQAPIFTRNVPRGEFIERAARYDVDEDRAKELYEERYNTLPWYSDVARGVKSGLGQIATTGGALAHAMGAEGFGQRAMDYGQDVTVDVPDPENPVDLTSLFASMFSGGTIS